MIIVLTGASGLIGSALRAQLQAQGNRIRRLARHPPLDPDEFCWDPDRGVLDPASLSGADAIVHLAGENIGSSRWTNAKKRRIRESRVRSTRLLSQAILRAEPPPEIFCCASAAGYYGSRGKEWLDEESAPGSNFLASVCQEWEEATLPAERHGLRVCRMRFAMVLGKEGGALAQLLPVFRWGFGGTIGHGNQFWSWIALPDLVDALVTVLNSAAFQGPINFSAPEPLPQREFAKSLGRVLHRPSVLPLPAPAARLLLGEMAEATLLASARLRPAKLLQHGFHFQFPKLEPALEALLAGL